MNEHSFVELWIPGVNKTKLEISWLSNISCHLICSSQYPKGTTKAPTLDLLRLTPIRGTKTAFLNPKIYDKHPYPFYVGVLPLPHQPQGASLTRAYYFKNLLNDHDSFHLISLCSVGKSEEREYNIIVMARRRVTKWNLLPTKMKEDCFLWLAFCIVQFVYTLS